MNETDTDQPTYNDSCTCSPNLETGLFHLSFFDITRDNGCCILGWTTDDNNQIVCRTPDSVNMHCNYRENVNDNGCYCENATTSSGECCDYEFTLNSTNDTCECTNEHC